MLLTCSTSSILTTKYVGFFGVSVVLLTHAACACDSMHELLRQVTLQE